MAAPSYKQDMPPPGGYKPIFFERVAAKKVLNAWKLAGIYFAFQIIGWTGYYFNLRRNEKLDTEDRAHRLSLQPLLIAERDRAYLKQLRKNRELETELMKDVPGWVVGTYYGEPIWAGRPKDEWQELPPIEFYAHSRYWDAIVNKNINTYF